jgi:hypothetical protein
LSLCNEGRNAFFAFTLGRLAQGAHRIRTRYLRCRGPERVGQPSEASSTLLVDIG